MFYTDIPAEAKMVRPHSRGRLTTFPYACLLLITPPVLGEVIATQGVTRIVGFGGKPVEIAVDEIEPLRLLTSSHFLREPWRCLPEGAHVVVETGPLAGVLGIICPSENGRRRPQIGAFGLN